MGEDSHKQIVIGRATIKTSTEGASALPTHTRGTIMKRINPRLLRFIKYFLAAIGGGRVLFHAGNRSDQNETVNQAFNCDQHGGNGGTTSAQKRALQGPWLDAKDPADVLSFGGNLALPSDQCKLTIIETNANQHDRPTPGSNGKFYFIYDTWKITNLLSLPSGSVGIRAGSLSMSNDVAPSPATAYSQSVRGDLTASGKLTSSITEAKAKLVIKGITKMHWRTDKTKTTNCWAKISMGQLSSSHIKAFLVFVSSSAETLHGSSAEYRQRSLDWRKWHRSADGSTPPTQAALRQDSFPPPPGVGDFSTAESSSQNVMLTWLGRREEGIMSHSCCLKIRSGHPKNTQFTSQLLRHQDIDSNLTLTPPPGPFGSTPEQIPKLVACNS